MKEVYTTSVGGGGGRESGDGQGGGSPAKLTRRGVRARSGRPRAMHYWRGGRERRGGAAPLGPLSATMTKKERPREKRAAARNVHEGRRERGR